MISQPAPEPSHIIVQLGLTIPVILISPVGTSTPGGTKSFHMCTPTLIITVAIYLVTGFSSYSILNTKVAFVQSVTPTGTLGN